MAPLDELLTNNYRSNSVNGIPFLMFAAIALLLASVGLYAVVAHSVSQRNAQEIGIRTAMGATPPGDILALVMKQGMLPVGIGLLVGLPAALAVTPILKSQLVHVSPADPTSLIVAAATLIVSATLGCWLPARRAMRVGPMVALRHESEPDSTAGPGESAIRSGATGRGAARRARVPGRHTSTPQRSRLLFSLRVPFASR